MTYRAVSLEVTVRHRDARFALSYHELVDGMLAALKLSWSLSFSAFLPPNFRYPYYKGADTS